MSVDTWKKKSERIKHRPLGDYVILVKDDITHIGSIELPDSVKGRASTGRVVANGPGVHLIYPGDRVLYGTYDGMTCVIDGKQEDEFVILRAECIRAVLET